jgi:hypothetical protein
LPGRLSEIAAEDNKDCIHSGLQLGARTAAAFQKEPLVIDAEYFQTVSYGI